LLRRLGLILRGRTWGNARNLRQQKQRRQHHLIGSRIPQDAKWLCHSIFELLMRKHWHSVGVKALGEQKSLC
jgi:hypothetical protein